MLTREAFVKMTEAVCIGKDVTYQDIQGLASAAQKYGFLLAIVPPCFTEHLIEMLQNSNTQVGAPLCGSDLGADLTEIKVAMARHFIDKGCREIDMLMNLMFFKSQMYDEVLHDIQSVREATKGACLKVIIESPLLTENEIKTACQLVIDGGADYVKTSTGTYGKTTVEQVQVIKEAVGSKVKIKAAGGIQFEMLEPLVDLGVSRFGLSYGKAVAFADALK